MNEIGLLDVKRVKLVCVRCKTEVVFDVWEEDGRGRFIPTQCPVCGSSYGMNPHNNVIERIRQAAAAAKETKGADVSILCEEEEA